MSSEDLAATAQRIIDSLLYIALATADVKGRPWVSPVWFAPASSTELLWASRPDTRHSRNIAVRPDVAIVIFDSTVPVGGAEAVYLEAVAEELDGAQLERGIAAYSRRAEEVGAGRWTLSDVTGPAPLRLYSATASAAFVLGPNDERLPFAPR